MQLVSRVHCPNLVLFYFILGEGFPHTHPKSSIGRNRESGSLSDKRMISSSASLVFLRTYFCVVSKVFVLPSAVFLPSVLSNSIHGVGCHAA